jgi:hypothetical protein
MGEKMISQVDENVRIRREGDPRQVVYDVVVETLQNKQWVCYQGFNSISDDYAFTNARESAGRAQKRLAIPA